MMGKTCFILLTLCFISSCVPKDTSKWSMQRISRYEESIKCTLGKKYSVKQRREMFPFNKAKKVLFIAFRNREMLGNILRVISEGRDSIKDSNGESMVLPEIEDINGCNSNEIIKKWEYFDIDTNQTFKILPDFCATESVALNSNQIDTLSNILINYQLNKSPLTCASVGCYNPRNAVLFLNAENKIVAFIEICFECIQMKFSYGLGNEQIYDCHCGERREAIKSLFASVGIKYGIETRH